MTADPTGPTGERRPAVTGGRLAVVVVTALHLLGGSLLILGLASGGGGLAASGVVAYALGLRHALDADHLCMIDNSTRKFVSEGKRSAAVGLAFSAGHSTVVLAAAALALAGSGVVGAAIEEDSATRRGLGLLGAAVAASYLAAIAVTNVGVLARAWGDLREAEPTATGAQGGLARLLRTPLARVREPWHVYGFGLLFGLGFDTASSVAVLVLATGLTSASAPITLLSLPLLFAAAMTLGDSLNGYLMLRLYSSAQHRHRARYNVVITAVSIAAALAISLLTFAHLALDLGVGWPGLDAVAGVDTDWAGAGLLGLFVVVGLVATAATHRPSPDRTPA